VIHKTGNFLPALLLLGSLGSIQMKMAVVWDVTPYSLVEVDLRFGVACCIYLKKKQDYSRILRAVSHERHTCFLSLLKEDKKN
jgi:hypothetical protein